VSTVLDGVRARAAEAGAEVSYARGADVLSPDHASIPEARALAAEADLALVVVGDVLDQVGEECDRSELELTGGQQALLEAVKATGTPLVVLLIHSKPACIPWVAEHADAIVEAFNPGMRGGEAISQILFGDRNPSGKLTVSFARSLGEQPVYYQQIPGWHGSKYGNYDPTPLFAFGFGLSYSEFEYGELRVLTPIVRPGDCLRVAIDVTNRSDRDGVEIVQLYVNDRFSSVTTPDKELKAYQRVELAAGATHSVELSVDYQALGLVTSAEQHVVEPGDFDVFVGSSSRDQDLKAGEFKVIA
jgi:beta-glucosidase